MVIYLVPNPSRPPLEVDRIMKFALFSLTAMAVLAVQAPSAGAAMPEGKVAVVKVTAVDGLAHHRATNETRMSMFSFDGTEYRIDRSALKSLDGVQTLVLIDRQRDERTGETTVRHHEQEVRAFGDTAFEVTDLKGKSLHYQVAMVGGNLRLVGDGDHIQAKAGQGGPFKMWKVTGVDLVDASAIILR